MCQDLGSIPRITPSKKKTFPQTWKKLKNVRKTNAKEIDLKEVRESVNYGDSQVPQA